MSTETKPNLLAIAGRLGSGKDTVGAIIQYLLHVNKEERTGRVPYSKLNDFLQGSVQYTDWKVKKFAAKVKQIASLLLGVPVDKFEDRLFKDSYLPREWDTLVPKPGKRQDGLFGTGEQMIKQTTVREFLQLLGTDAIRNNLHPNTWVNALFADYRAYDKGKGHDLVNWAEVYQHNACQVCGKSYAGYKRQYLCRKCIEDDAVQINPNWIITDLRFPNEFEAIKSRGGLCIRVERFPDVVRSTGPGKQTTEKFDTTNEQHTQLWEGESLRLHPSETALDSHIFDYVLNNSGSIEDLVEEVRKMFVHFKLLEA